MYANLSGISPLPAHRPLFILFLGYLIYADVFKLYTGLESDIPLYHARYRVTLSEPHYRSLSQSTAMYYMIDNHEIIDDFHQKNETDTYVNAVRAWREYTGMSNLNPVAEDGIY